jgi:hypothetical protein
MKIREYLIETNPTKMPLKQFRYFKALAKEFLANHPGYKYTSINGFMKDLQDDDYKSLSVLFNNLGVGSQEEFLKKYKDYVDKVNESPEFISSKDKARKAKLDKVIKSKGSRAEYAHADYVIELISGDEWPSNSDLIWYADHPGGGPFGGRVSKGMNNTKIVTVHTD